MPDVYWFGNGNADGHAGMKDILGGKGANLAEMTNLGIPVPPGFTISANLCTAYLAHGKLPDSLRSEVEEAMTRLEAATGRGFGDAENPLLVSVRSGAKFSMPGMMDTILNLGLNERTAEAMGRQANNPRFAFDSLRRLVQMYGEVVFGIKDRNGGNPFDVALETLKRDRGTERDIDLEVADLRSLVRTYEGIVCEETGHPFPDDPWAQLWGAIEAVFRSWQTKRATDYRRVHRIPDDLGTAVNIVAMVYGNMGDDCATGVAFTRDPATGEKRLYGEFLVNAQGEDVVAGIRDPEPITEMEKRLPDGYRQFRQICDTLERHYRDMQDVEFTIERGTLYLLQTRAGKRTAQAAVRIAVEMALHPTVDPHADLDVLVTGLPASPGAAVGKVVFDADRAAELASSGADVVLVRRETSPDDFHGMVAAKAILTARGGMTSHAAVVARGMGKCCVVGAKDVSVDEGAGIFKVDSRAVREGEWITVDGSSGRVFLGRARLVEPHPSEHLTHLMGWADSMRRLRVRTNADTPADAAKAREFGAEGIGLCRTEHMFFHADRIMKMREMILATDAAGRHQALDALLPMQREDFIGIFRAMDGYPVTIRLLDPPLHEFLPTEEAEIRHLAADLGVDPELVHRAIDGLTEANPMLGHRGCRLGITYPEITEMQARAIFEAACLVAADGIDVHPEIMVPLVAHVEELRRQAQIVRAVAEQVFADRRRRVEYLVGTMIELPRAAVTADEIASEAEFFSFGTNDLTQTTFGLSRDDAGRFLPAYIESGILADDPFQTLDVAVEKLIETAVALGRGVRPDLKIGICGEHGGDPRSVAFCHRAELNYVSSSPYRVPIARLAAARAALG
jgi:pyruvate,orthophosphate dikinase